MRGADAIVFLFSVRYQDTLHNNIQFILKVRNNNIPKEKTVPMILVGNMIDLVEEREVTREMVMSELHANGLDDVIYMECSARTGEGIEDILHELCGKLGGIHLNLVNANDNC